MGLKRSRSEWEPWKQAYRHGTLVIWPPSSVRESVGHWREQLDPVSHGYAPAHVTLTQPFRAQVTDEDWDRVSAIVQAEHAFEVTYGPLRSFLPSPVLWLEVQPSQRILELRRRLHSLGLFDLSMPHTDDFVPHMTITEGLSGPTVDEALLLRLRTEVQGGAFECAHVVYLAPDDDFRFKRGRQLPLSDP
jgi:2'-5' RNA ligase